VWTYDQALRLICAYLDISHNGKCVVIEEATLDLPYGRVFFYDSRAHLETGVAREALIGNAPIIFNRVSGELRVTGTAHPIEHYLREYESTLPAVHLQMKPQLRSR
jgi:hypothetical protein